MVAPEGMLGRYFDEDERQAVGIGGAKLDQAPGFLDRALDDRHSRRAQLALDFPDVPYLKPELRRQCRDLVLTIGQLQEPSPKKENDPARGPCTELPHGMEP